MTEQVHCSEGGWLVNPPLEPADDPADFAHPRSGIFIGCSRLRCWQCGQMVRAHANLYFHAAAERAAELHAAADGSSLDGAQHAPGLRTYACACTAHAVTTPQALSPDDDEAARLLDLPWRCAGHPPGTLPLVVDGERLHGDTDLDVLVRRVLNGSPPPACHGQHRAFPAEWLCRLYLRLRHLPLGQKLGEAVASCLLGSDEQRAGGALVFFDRFPRAPGHAQVAIALRRALGTGSPTGHRTRYGDQFFVFDLLEVLARQLDVDEGTVDAEVLALCQQALSQRRTEVASRVWRTLAQHDASWLVAHAPALAGACVDNLEPLLAALQMHDGALLAAALDALRAPARGWGPSALQQWLQQNPQRAQRYGGPRGA